MSTTCIQRVFSEGSVDPCGVERDPEGLYLKASQLGGKEFVIWPEEHDAENETN